ncbi:MAG TPA: GYD domain-containing protein [Ramlibacter sp.]|nr:GYD domain-containing protein [Ramlibacter sp.]
MATYVILGTFTDQGIRVVKDTTKRADLAKEIGAKFGVTMREIYWTQGQYDIVTLCEAPDEAAISAFGLAIASLGNVRFQTLRALNRDEMNAVLRKLP